MFVRRSDGDIWESVLFSYLVEAESLVSVVFHAPGWLTFQPVAHPSSRLAVGVLRLPVCTAVSNFFHMVAGVEFMLA